MLPVERGGLVVRAWIQHAAFQQSIREELAKLPPAIREKAHLWEDELFFVWHAELDALGPTVCRRYSSIGRPVPVTPQPCSDACCS
jgi:hypothetical protein